MKLYAFVMPVLGLSLLLAAEASAIPLNLDFGAQFALRKPAATFGAASGQAGVWNAITAFETPSGIVDLAGGATNVAVSITATFMEGLHQCQVFPFEDGCPLLENNFYSWGDEGWTLLITGLLDGFYDIYLYEPSNLLVSLGDGEVNDRPFANIGAEYTGSFVEGKHYVRLPDVRIEGGSLRATASTDRLGLAGLAGLQIVHASGTVPEPRSLALVALGLGGLYRLRRQAAG